MLSLSFFLYVLLNTDIKKEDDLRHPLVAN